MNQKQIIIVVTKNADNIHGNPNEDEFIKDWSGDKDSPYIYKKSDNNYVFAIHGCNWSSDYSMSIQNIKGALVDAFNEANIEQCNDNRIIVLVHPLYNKYAKYEKDISPCLAPYGSVSFQRYGTQIGESNLIEVQKLAQSYLTGDRFNLTFAEVFNKLSPLSSIYTLINIVQRPLLDPLLRLHLDIQMQKNNIDLESFIRQFRSVLDQFPKALQTLQSNTIPKLANLPNELATIQTQFESQLPNIEALKKEGVQERCTMIDNLSSQFTSTLNQFQKILEQEMSAICDGTSPATP